MTLKKCVAAICSFVLASFFAVAQSSNNFMTESDLAKRLIDSMKIKSELPPSANTEDYFTLLEARNIRPINGWNATNAITVGTCCRLYVQVLGKEAEIGTPDDDGEYCNYLSKHNHEFGTVMELLHSIDDLFASKPGDIEEPTVVPGPEKRTITKKDLCGIFSNESSGFDIATLMIHENGQGYFHGAVAGLIGEWTFDHESSVLIFTCFDPGNDQEASLEITFDSGRNCYILPEDESSSRQLSHRSLCFITNTIPEELVQALAAYPEQLQKHRQELKIRKERKQQRQEKLEREEPEYQRLLQAISNDARTVVDPKFYAIDDTPESRAFITSMDNHQIHYPENVLIELLDSLPPDNGWYRVKIFARPEISAETIERYYPQALDWGARLNYNILANIANHTNTPLYLIEDLATKRDLPGGATGPAQRQMVKYAERMIEQMDTTQETLIHLYQFALQLPQNGNTDNGKNIIRELTKSSAIPTNILMEIVRSDDQLFLRSIALNRNTSPTTLKWLASSKFTQVRSDIAEHPDVPVETLLVLSKDKEARVRAKVAKHPSTPSERLKEMRTDEDKNVRNNVKRNPSTPVNP